MRRLPATPPYPPPLYPPPCTRHPALKRMLDRDKKKHITSLNHKISRKTHTAQAHACTYAVFLHSVGHPPLESILGIVEHLQRLIVDLSSNFKVLTRLYQSGTRQPNGPPCYERACQKNWRKYRCRTSYIGGLLCSRNQVAVHLTRSYKL